MTRFPSPPRTRARSTGRRARARAAPWLIVLLAGLGRCDALPGPGDPLSRSHDEIVACGELFHTTTPVVLWLDPGGYDAYRVEPRFPDLMTPEELEAWTPRAHYHSVRRHLPEPLRRRAARNDLPLAALRDHVDQFVIHYDASGTSRRCFQVLHDRRGLSVHFLLDVDGTVYQTLDLKERAWHAAEANDRSVGVEIAHIGAYPPAKREVLDRWYVRRGDAVSLVLPEGEAESLRRDDLRPAPRRPDPTTGTIHGRELIQYDFTKEQYEALARLLAAVHRVLPRIRLDAPRDGDGSILARALTREERQAFSGVLGHYHVTERKVDPGPAFDWESVLARARALCGACPHEGEAEAAP